MCGVNEPLHVSLIS